jgi:aminoglycoside 6'-N-acetyltransferase I
MAHIRPLTGADHPLFLPLARILMDAFRVKWPNAYPELQAALEEIEASLDDGRLSLVLLDEDDRPLGWVAAERQYDGHTWELHPLVVDPARQGEGFGRALVEALETAVRDRGATTLWVASDDETGLTSLFGHDLYPDPLAHLARIRDVSGHPFGFYQRLGFALVGVLPDANGLGKPDVFLAKRL